MIARKPSDDCERLQLAHTWMTMTRQKVNHHYSDDLDASLKTLNNFQPR